MVFAYFVVFAYLDATTGVMIIQTLIAAMIAIPLIFRSQVGRALALLKRRGQPATEQEGQPQDD